MSIIMKIKHHGLGKTIEAPMPIKDQDVEALAEKAVTALGLAQDAWELMKSAIIYAVEARKKYADEPVIEMDFDELDQVEIDTLRVDLV